MWCKAKNLVLVNLLFDRESFMDYIFNPHIHKKAHAKKCNFKRPIGYKYYQKFSDLRDRVLSNQFLYKNDNLKR